MYPQLVKDWIVLQKAPRDSEEYTRLFWAFNKMVELIDSRPQECLDVILAILHEAQGDDFILANLAAGPLESLLVAHGIELIDKIESLANQDPNFQKLLGGVWKNDMPDKLWNRVQAVAGPPL